MTVGCSPVTEGICPRSACVLSSTPAPANETVARARRAGSGCLPCAPRAAPGTGNAPSAGPHLLQTAAAGSRRAREAACAEGAGKPLLSWASGAGSRIGPSWERGVCGGARALGPWRAPAGAAAGGDRSGRRVSDPRPAPPRVRDDCAFPCVSPPPPTSDASSPPSARRMLSRPSSRGLFVN